MASAYCSALSYHNSPCSDFFCDSCTGSGASCVGPGECACSSGSYPPPPATNQCTKHFCDIQCVHGTCVGQNECKCDDGWTGVDCSIGTCTPPCGEHGNCVMPSLNFCECLPGFTQCNPEVGNCTGTQCSMSICTDPVVGVNGSCMHGKCVPRGTSNFYCQCDYGCDTFCVCSVLPQCFFFWFRFM